MSKANSHIFSELRLVVEDMTEGEEALGFKWKGHYFIIGETKDRKGQKCLHISISDAVRCEVDEDLDDKPPTLHLWVYDM